MPGVWRLEHEQIHELVRLRAPGGRQRPPQFAPCCGGLHHAPGLDSLDVATTLGITLLRTQFEAPQSAGGPALALVLPPSETDAFTFTTTDVSGATLTPGLRDQ